jgi:diacylglycerol kinase (ATP)
VAEPPILLIANPGARSSLASAEVALGVLTEAGRDVRLAVSEAPGHGVVLASRAQEEGVGTVVAVGGDGTIGEVCRGLLRAEGHARLGIVPAGTGNDSAKSLGLPLDPLAATRVLLEGSEQPIDLGEVNGHPFMGISVLGFAADVGRTVNRWKLPGGLRPQRALGPRMYLLASVWHLAVRPRPLHARLWTEDEPARSLSVFTVLVGNQPGVGGVFLPCPAGSPRDGVLDTCVILAREGGRPLGLGRQMRTLRAATDGSHLGLPWVEYVRTSRAIHLEFDRPIVALADGDELPAAASYTLRPLPAAVRLLLPRREEDSPSHGTVCGAASGPL